MMKAHVALRLLGTACLLAVVVAAGGAMAKSADAPTRANGGKMVAAVTQPVSAPIETPAAIKELPVIKEATPACARKVKVVYAGYGEADRATCSTTSAKVAAD